MHSTTASQRLRSSMVGMASSAVIQVVPLFRLISLLIFFLLRCVFFRSASLPSVIPL
nr:MAG TPA: hypothetical protein [Caudoviricetes sp.]